MTPTLTTPRLTLRPATMADFAAYKAFVMSDRAQYMGGPHSAQTAWSWFCNDTAQWSLLGMGALLITRTGDDTAIGQVALCHGPIFPEPELGWFLYGGHEGQGYAFEAARALRDWGFGPRNLPTMVSYIDPANRASARVAQKLGAQIDTAAATPDNMPTQVWRFARGQA